MSINIENKEESENTYKYLMEILKNNDKNNITLTLYENLILACNGTNRYEEERYYGKLIIKLKKEEAIKIGKKIYKIPLNKNRGLSNDKNKNIISYSLYGDDSKYCETAIYNIDLAKKIYPEWTCRFYIDESVPLYVVNKLKDKGAEVIYVSEDEKKIPGVFWRFFVIDDKNVQCFLIRDADSLLSYKEEAAVREWLNSKKVFHIMRDSSLHVELILAGMWGGYTGIFENIKDMILNFLDEVKTKTKMIDQIFLKEFVWTTVSQSVLIHDSNILEEESNCYPDYIISEIEKIPYFHIGMIDSNKEIITIYLDKNDNRKIAKWFLVDENRNTICTYNSKIIENEKKEKLLEINLPYFYSINVKKNKWQILVEVNPMEKNENDIIIQL